MSEEGRSVVLKVAVAVLAVAVVVLAVMVGLMSGRVSKLEADVTNTMVVAEDALEKAERASSLLEEVARPSGASGPSERPDD